MTTIAQIPGPVRRALAYRAALECLGYTSDQIFIVPTTAALAAKLPDRATIRPPVDAAPLGATWLLVTLSTAARFDQTDVVIVTGWIDPVELATSYPEAAMEAYNVLEPAARAAERQRWISLQDLVWLAAQLLQRGMVPNLAAAMAAAVPPGRH